MNPPTGCEALRLASIPARDLRNLKCYGWLRGSDSSVTSNQKVKKFHTSPRTGPVSVERPGME